MTKPTASLPRYFWRTAPHSCPYLAGRVERNVFTEIGGKDGHAGYDALVRHGFRRSQRIVYRPDCPSCSACVPVRVVADGFAPSRSLRRVLAENRDMDATESPAVATLEQFRLFGRYALERHDGGEMAAMTFHDYRRMIEDSPVETAVVEFRSTGGALAAACLMDRVSEGLSAVYSFYDPALAARSLGTYMVLWLIYRARADRLPYVYLGYWIAQSRKMSYKTRFRPLEAFGPDGWRLLVL